jgi:hypothetical protein
MTGEKMQATVPAEKKGGEVMQVHTPIRIRRIGRSPRPTNYSNTCGADNGGATAGVVKEREAGKPARDGAHSTLSSNVVQLLKECDIEDAADALERNGWTSLKKIKLMDDKDVDAMKLRRATQKVLKTKLCTWKAEQEENEKNEKLPHTATTTAFVQVMTTAGTAEVVQVMTTAGTAKAMTPVAAGGHEELARRLQEQDEQALEASRLLQQAEDARLAQALELDELEPTGSKGMLITQFGYRRFRRQWRRLISQTVPSTAATVAVAQEEAAAKKTAEDEAKKKAEEEATKKAAEETKRKEEEAAAAKKKAVEEEAKQEAAAAQKKAEEKAKMKAERAELFSSFCFFCETLNTELARSLQKQIQMEAEGEVGAPDVERRIPKELTDAELAKQLRVEEEGNSAAAPTEAKDGRVKLGAGACPPKNRAPVLAASGGKPGLEIKAMNVDGDGVLSQQELLSKLRNMGWSLERAEQTFKCIERDGDGGISANEYAAFCQMEDKNLEFGTLTGIANLRQQFADRQAKLAAFASKDASKDQEIENLKKRLTATKKQLAEEKREKELEANLKKMKADLEKDEKDMSEDKKLNVKKNEEIEDLKKQKESRTRSTKQLRSIGESAYNIPKASGPQPSKQDLSRFIEEHQRQVENNCNNQLNDSERYKKVLCDAMCSGPWRRAFAMESQRSVETEQLCSGEGAREGAGLECHPVPNTFDSIVSGLSLGVRLSFKAPSSVASPVCSACASAASPVPASALATQNVSTSVGTESGSLCLSPYVLLSVSLHLSVDPALSPSLPLSLSPSLPSSLPLSHFLSLCV